MLQRLESASDGCVVGKFRRAAQRLERDSRNGRATRRMNIMFGTEIRRRVSK